MNGEDDMQGRWATRAGGAASDGPSGAWRLSGPEEVLTARVPTLALRVARADAETPGGEMLILRRPAMFEVRYRVDGSMGVLADVERLEISTDDVFHAERRTLGVFIGGDAERAFVRDFLDGSRQLSRRHA